MISEPVSRRQSLALLSSLALAACSRADAAPVLKVGSQKAGTKALIVSSGVLADAPYQVEWSEFPAAQPLLEAVGSGAIDVGLAGDAPFQFAYQNGSPIKAIAAQRNDPRPLDALGIVVPHRSPVRNLNDLVGKSVATTRGSIGHYLVLRALDEAKLPFDAVRFTWLAPGDAKAAFDSGAIDAWAIWVPYLTMALGSAGRVVVDGQTLVRGYSFEIANESAIAAKRDLLRDFASREANALRWAAKNPHDYARVLAGETGLPLDVARTMVDKNQRQPVAIDAGAIGDQQIVLDTFRKSGEIKGSRPLDTAFLDLRA